MPPVHQGLQGRSRGLDRKPEVSQCHGKTVAKPRGDGARVRNALATTRRSSIDGTTGGAFPLRSGDDRVGRRRNKVRRTGWLRAGTDLTDALVGKQRTDEYR